MKVAPSLADAIPFRISKSAHHALLVQEDVGDYFYDKLHYHPEFQITAIVQGEGLLYAGNSTISFEPKSVFLIGSNVPHLLKNSSEYYGNPSPGCKGFSLFFDQFSFGERFFEISELSAIKRLLEDSSRAIKVVGNDGAIIHDMICKAQNCKDEQLVILFLQILSKLCKCKKEYINLEQYQLRLNENEGGRLNDVLDFTFANYSEEITIEQIAQIASLSRSQFSTFFKLHTSKTYIQFLRELRIENACMMLKSPMHTIEQVAYAVGFKNISNFVRQFKKVKLKTPSQYRKDWAVAK